MFMENIYLSIIILVVLLKVYPSFFQAAKTYALLGYKRVKINGLYFVIKKLTPLDFIDSGEGFPITFFEIKRGVTLWEQARGDIDNKQKEPSLSDKIKTAKLVCVKGTVYFPANLKADDFFNESANEKALEVAFKLYAQVMAFNFPNLCKVFEIKRENVIHIAELCAKLGQQPHKHLTNPKNLTSLEKYMIDEFFYNQLLAKENAEIKKQNDQVKKGKGKKR